MAAIRGILFDLDGTIADTIDFFYALTCEILAEARCEPVAREVVLEAIAHGTAAPDRFLPADFADREGFLERIYRERFPVWTARYGSETRPLPGAVEVLDRLHRDGYRLGLVTSSYGELPFLDRWDVRRCFDAVVCRQHVTNIKPHPEAVLAGIAGLRLEPPEVVVVGDTPLDVRAGLAAGVETIGVLTGAGSRAQLLEAGASAVLASLGELPAFLESRTPPAGEGR